MVAALHTGGVRAEPETELAKITAAEAFFRDPRLDDRGDGQL